MSTHPPDSADASARAHIDVVRIPSGAIRREIYEFCCTIHEVPEKSREPLGKKPMLIAELEFPDKTPVSIPGMLSSHGLSGVMVFEEGSGDSLLIDIDANLITEQNLRDQGLEKFLGLIEKQARSFQADRQPGSEDKPGRDKEPPARMAAR